MQDSKRDTDVKSRLLDSVGEGEGGTTWENSIETCILSYAKEIIKASVMNEAGHSKLVLWDNPEKWGGEGVWRGFSMGGHMYICGWFMSMYGKNHHNIVISLQLKLINYKKETNFHLFFQWIWAQSYGLSPLLK